MSCQVLEQSREGDVSLTYHCVIDEREGSHILRSHLSLEIGPSKDNFYCWIVLFDATRQGQTRHVLLEGRTEPYHCIAPPVHHVQAILDVGGQHLMAQGRE